MIMSWSGTVNCRWCGGRGHNKRTCPHYTETLKQRALDEINNGEGYDGEQCRGADACRVAHEAESPHAWVRGALVGTPVLDEVVHLMG